MLTRGRAPCRHRASPLCGCRVCEASQPLIAGDGEDPGTELGVAPEEVKITPGLNEGFLCGFLGFDLVFEDGKGHEVNGSLAGPNQQVKQVLLACENAENALNLRFRFNVCHCAYGKQWSANRSAA